VGSDNGALLFAKEWAMSPDVPPFVDRTLLAALLRSVLGTSATLISYRIALERDDYAVVVATLGRPEHEVVVKLAGPRAPIACPFDRTATIVALVRNQTPVPTFDVLAADISYRAWPWRYLVMTHLAGTPWAQVGAHLAADVHRRAYRDLGEMVAHLHTIRFPAFGEIGPKGLSKNKLYNFSPNPRLNGASA